MITPQPRRVTVQREIAQCRFTTLLDAVDEDSGALLTLRRLTDGTRASNVRPLALDQLEREARLMAELASPHLPRLMGVLGEAPDLQLLYERIDGHALDHVVANLSGMPGQPLLGRWLHQAASVLQLLHERGVIVRDIRPQSIMISASGQLMLVDLGLAAMGQSDDDDLPFRSQGAPHYAAPEQLRGERASSAMDLYGLGATFYHVATGRRPPTALERLEHDAPLEPARSINSRLTPQFSDLLMQLMALDPAERPPSASALEDLMDIADVACAVHLSGGAQAAPAWSPPPSPLSPEEAQRRPAPDDSAAAAAAAAAADADSNRRGLLSFLPWKSRRSDATRPSEDETSPDDLHRYPRLDLASFPLERSVGRLLPEAVARRIDGVCVGQPSARELTIVVKKPDVYIYDHVSYVTNGAYKPVIMVADAALIDLAIEYVYKVGERHHHVTWREWLEKKRFHGQDLSLVFSQEQEALLQMEEVKGPAIEAVDRMIKEAISIRASDVHIETYESDVVLRYRIDGILHVMDTWPRRDAAAYIKRVKIMANMDIAQEMLPQGGRISVRVSDQEYDLRVSCVPVPDGESIVMRLLPKGTFEMRLEDLGFGPGTLEIYRRLTEQPHGMLLVSGPTGSGKSTTLYATLAEINRPDRKILTVEDPIEYKMHGVVQVQVNTNAREEEKRLTFARALREFLRQDPDVILVGEIRDDETAAISVQAALTGHLLLSTVHTNDAVTIVTRLRDRGVEPFLISSTLLGGIAQRLVRKICPGCREEVPLHPTARRMFEAEGVDDPRVFTGRGCEQCHRTGYRGRIAIYEVLEINDELRDMVASSANAGEIVRAAKRYGMTSLFHDGLRKVRDGLVPLEEVKRVCMTV